MFWAAILPVVWMWWNRSCSPVARYRKYLGLGARVSQSPKLTKAAWSEQCLDSMCPICTADGEHHSPRRQAALVYTFRGNITVWEKLWGYLAPRRRGEQSPGSQSVPPISQKCISSAFYIYFESYRQEEVGRGWWEGEAELANTI